ncbi:MAG: sugar transferase, partial [Alphaproteobacteria bacterium]
MTKIEQAEFVGKSGLFRFRDVSGYDRPWNALLRMDYSEDRRVALRSLFVALEAFSLPFAGILIRSLVPALRGAIARPEFVWMAVLAGILTVLLGGQDRKIVSIFAGHARESHSLRRSVIGAMGTLGVVFGLLELGLFVSHGFGRDSAMFILLWSILSLFVLSTERYLTLRYVSSLRAAGRLTQRLAIVGAGSSADQLIAHLERFERDNQLEIVGVFDDRRSRVESFRNRPTGTISDLIQAGKDSAIDRILITLPYSAEGRILDTVRRLKSLAGDIALLPAVADWCWPSATDEILDHAHFSLAKRPIAKWNAVLKRIEDLVLGGTLLLVCLPVMAMIALAIRLEGPGPILFRQRRHGYNNAEFDVFKFRSMQHSLGDPTGAKQASRSDDRVTIVGKLIRRLSLDELPQLLNVI